MMFLNFSNFLAFIFEFSNSGRVGMDRNEIFFLLYYSAGPDPILLEMKRGRYLLSGTMRKHTQVWIDNIYGLYRYIVWAHK